MNTNNG